MGKILIVTGMSGAGKTICLKLLEDKGYYAVDNLPVELLDKFVELSLGRAVDFKNIALGIDVRHERDFGELKKILKSWDDKKINYSVLFLDATDKALIARFKETRREHPLLKGRKKIFSLEELLQEERKKITWLKEKSDYYLNTSDYKIGDLKNSLETLVVSNKKITKLNVNIVSFGYKYGIPSDADIVFDVRFLPNPYYVDKLKKKTGKDEAVKKYIKQNDEYKIFMDKFFSLIEFSLPYYDKEGKDSITIATGCTGGHHRSVCVAEDLYKLVKNTRKYITNIEHRDIKR